MTAYIRVFLQDIRNKGTEMFDAVYSLSQNE